MKHVEIELRQRGAEDYSIEARWNGSWYASSPANRWTDFIQVGYIASSESKPLTYDQCLVAAIKRAQELGYDSFSITTHPHPDYEEDTFSQDDLNVHVANDIGRLRDDLDGLGERVDDRLTSLYRSYNHLHDWIRGIDTRLKQVEKNIESLYDRTGGR